MGAAELINLIRKDVLKALKNEMSGLELGTVVSPPPDLVIKVDNMNIELSKNDLLVCERLARNSRVASIVSQPGTMRDLGDGKGQDQNSMGNLPANLSYAAFRFEDILKKGDRILVQAIPGGQKYIIMDRVVSYG